MRRSHVATGFLEQLISAPQPGVHVRREGEFYYVNLHVGQINAGSHSKNLRGGQTMSRYGDVVKLFQRVRDESHRFAISYHETLRRSGQLKSKLEDIPGVGEATRKKLIRAFGSMRGVSGSSLEDIQAAVGERVGLSVYNYFHKVTLGDKK